MHVCSHHISQTNMAINTEKFIMEIKNRPCLWDSGLEEYSDRHLKSKCWDELVDIFKQNDLTTEEKELFGESLQKKWRCIRGCFTREIKRQKNVKSGSTHGRKNEYVFFKQLKFLKGIVTSRDDPEVNEIPEMKSERHKVIKKPPKRIKIETVLLNDTLPENDEVFTDDNRTIQNRDQYNKFSEDEDRLFMLSLVDTLKRVPKQRKMATKIKIMSLLDEATLSNSDSSE